MFKKILLFLILLIITALIYVYTTSNLVKNIKEGKDLIILLVLNENINQENEEIKIVVSKYNSLSDYIKMVFVDENITILQKTKKSRTLKNMILEIKPNDRIEFIKSEVEKLFDNKININYYISFNKSYLQNIVKVFSKQSDLEENLKLVDISLQSEVNRDTNIVSVIKIFNYIYYNFNRLVFINFIKSLYNEKIVLNTNFELKDLFLLYSNILNENKAIKYADFPTSYRRKRIELDEKNRQNIISFFVDDKIEYQNNISVEVLNTTSKDRLAIKAVNKLRENNFDVIDWGSISKQYEYTTIINFIDNYEQIKEIKNILNCGEIIFRPTDKILADVSVLLGQDCNIYDKLDRKTED